ncbi:MAG: glycoside hydrolase family 3 N-terminal domain-containing protein [Chloroflexota bacterium]
MARALSRRQFLAGAGATVGTLVLGCSINEIATPKPTISFRPRPTPAPTNAPSPTPSSSPVPLRVRAAQMLICGFPGKTLADDDPIIRAIRDDGLGGVILFARNIESPAQLRNLTATLRGAAGARPLLIAVDQEGGAVARLNPDNGFAATPTAAKVGRRNDPSYAHEVGSDIGRTLADAGINLNFAPVVDLNVNPANPSIGALDRSFSADPNVVVAMASEFIAGHREHGVLTTLKHFPGLGSATGNTDREFVDITTTWTQAELEPFRQLIAAGNVDLVMVGNALNGQLDLRNPATLSAPTHNLLRDDLGWDGVVVTDDLMAGALTANYPPDVVLRRAIRAGNDLLLLANTARDAGDVVQPTLDVIESLVAQRQIDEILIDTAGARIGRLIAPLG